MTTVHRAATRRRAAALAASLAIAGGLVGTLAAPASATEPGDTGHFVDQAQSTTADIEGSFPGQDEMTYKAGLNLITIDGEDDEAAAYCVRPPKKSICQKDSDYALHEGDWDSSGIENRDIVEAILASYFPIGDGPEGYGLVGTDEEKAAATQAAIWHFTDGFTLGSANPANILANYATILQAVDDDALASSPEHLELSIEEPDETEGLVNQLLGPYIVHTNAASVELMPDAGLTVHHEDGSPFTGPAHDGDELWITSDSAGYFSLYAKVKGVKTKVRYFKSDEYQYKAELQDCFFAVVTEKEKKVGVMVDFDTPPPTSTPPTSDTPTTTPPETTVPVTPETSVVVTTAPPGETTTVPVTPSQGGGLPVTGAQSVLLTALALALIGIGAAFGIVSRRRRSES